MNDKCDSSLSQQCTPHLFLILLIILLPATRGGCSQATKTTADLLCIQCCSILQWMVRARRSLTNAPVSSGIYIVFFSIVYQAFVPIGFILWILTIWLNLNKRPINLWQQFKDVEFWFILYYLLLIIGMFWTDNQIFGLSKIENKLSFILFPILFRFSKINLNRGTIFSILLFGLFISLLFYESVGVYKSIY